MPRPRPPPCRAHRLPAGASQRHQGQFECRCASFKPSPRPAGNALWQPGPRAARNAAKPHRRHQPRTGRVSFGSGDVLLDVAGLAETVGLADWHNPQLWNMGKFAFSDELIPLYADHVARCVAAIRGKSRKVLILDLDNTVWGGVIGDDGLEGIKIAQGDATRRSAPGRAAAGARSAAARNRARRFVKEHRRGGARAF
jgi:hypothetical protein